MGNLLVGDGGINVLDGNQGWATLVGQGGDDLLLSTSAGMYGELACDWLQKGRTLVDQPGNDKLVVVPPAPPEENSGGPTEAGNVVAGGPGNDLIDLGGIGSASVTYCDAPGAVTVNMSTSPGTSTGAAGADTIHNLPPEFSLVGSDVSDNLTGSNLADDIYGGSGSDTINGMGGNDYLRGQSGQDPLSGGANTDICHEGIADISCETVTDPD